MLKMRDRGAARIDYFQSDPLTAVNIEISSVLHLADL